MPNGPVGVVTDSDKRIATSIGLIVVGYGQFDQMLYAWIGHAETERFNRARKKENPEEPIKKELRADFDQRRSYWRQLCNELCVGNKELMSKIDAFVTRLNNAVECRDKLVHGLVIDNNDNGIKVYNHYALLQYQKEHRKAFEGPPEDIVKKLKNLGSAISHLETLYSFDHLESVRVEFWNLYWDMTNLTNDAIMKFR